MTTLYDQDFYLWTKQTADLLETSSWQEVDLANLIAEIESMGAADKQALKSKLKSYWRKVPASNATWQTFFQMFTQR